MVEHLLRQSEEICWRGLVYHVQFWVLAQH
jgi:hypothetical protein